MRWIYERIYCEKWEPPWADNQADASLKELPSQEDQTFMWLHVQQAHSELCIHRSNNRAISKITQGTQLLNLLAEQPYYPEDLQ